jgi:CxxH/CxxC protein (TIGR04129 family)
MNYKEIYSCKEHIEIALDDFVDEYEVFPLLEKCENKQCSYCQEKAEYKVYAN